VVVVTRVILVLTLPVALACAAFGKDHDTTRGHQAPGVIVSSVDTQQHAIGASDEESTTPEEDGNGVVDLYGNQVTAAVAKYKLDATGTLYELHSPQTELPRLPSPKS
jgi:hypothetical protein